LTVFASLTAAMAELPMYIHPEVADALTAKRAVVALESTIISHGKLSLCN
jgi:pseudouridine-5'-phosphate glycosidase